VLRVGHGVDGEGQGVGEEGPDTWDKGWELRAESMGLGAEGRGQ
jgi:hypothetical protein